MGKSGENIGKQRESCKDFVVVTGKGIENLLKPWMRMLMDHCGWVGMSRCPGIAGIQLRQRLLQAIPHSFGIN
eukprot:6404679-Amphidinium_carterae.1